MKTFYRVSDTWVNGHYVGDAMSPFKPPGDWSTSIELLRAAAAPGVSPDWEIASIVGVGTYLRQCCDGSEWFTFAKRDSEQL